MAVVHLLLWSGSFEGVEERGGGGGCLESVRMVGVGVSAQFTCFSSWVLGWVDMMVFALVQRVEVINGADNVCFVMIFEL